jgi:hypothetical protein
VSATKQGKSTLLVSPTWAEIDAVTKQVRDKLKAQGVVGQNEETVPVFDSLSWTEAQKKDVRQFETGQRLRFVRQTKKFDRGETVEVVATTESGLRVRRPDGTEVDLIPASSARSFDVGESRELKIAAGDWLLLQANHGKDFINGERVQVKAIQDGRITLADGRALPAGFNTFTHGYAVTSHSSQGKTVDEVLLVASSKSFPAVNREQFYVSISRGRERVQIFTDDSELLARRVTDSHERKAAVELTELHQELAKLGFTRKQKTSPPASADVRPDFRQHRVTRLSSVQRLTQMVNDVRRWLGLEHTEAVVEKIAPGESVTPVEKISPANETKKLRPEPPMKVRPTIKPNVPPPRRSRGMGV